MVELMPTMPEHLETQVQNNQSTQELLTVLLTR